MPLSQYYKLPCLLGWNCMRSERTLGCYINDHQHIPHVFCKYKPGSQQFVIQTQTLLYGNK